MLTEANTESQMRYVLILVAAFIVGGVVAGTGPSQAGMGWAPALGALNMAPDMVQNADYVRRFYRRNGYLPGAGPNYAPPIVDEMIVAPVDTVIIVPLRPASCGEFRYWNGDRCVDARYHTPYIGPR